MHTGLFMFATFKAPLTMKINADRLQSDLKSLSQIGRTPEGGVSRPIFSQADMKARKVKLAN